MVDDRVAGGYLDYVVRSPVNLKAKSKQLFVISACCARRDELNAILESIMLPRKIGSIILPSRQDYASSYNTAYRLLLESISVDHALDLVGVGGLGQCQREQQSRFPRL